ncbi:16S rRNA (guanine(966)-N(2))-methyltransferase RsmD [Halomonas sp. hl-4]|uniref:16S rRNA (guanine(966)-N(2))-methyltransferase RsmD n=1 Tax=Halomonas sp. hl-4 TaxID=1761789 RepID=UPI000BB79808|nr:16S rRNA (guanine(966)-N(2))-methyltransferase RsmD [Halomonas sp. hl-4]SNY97346.1 16S rRNA m(2)G-966 methyltransferase [Halomonas sp. hl-4]
MTRQRSSRSSAARRSPAKPMGKLRIIGGDFRRRQLPVLDSPGLRPTPDRVRETLFNWLGQTLYGKKVLDLFAGTGALGVEALSRGAAQVAFIERDTQVAAHITRNLETLQANQGHVIIRDAQVFLAQPAQRFDVVFLDPPFHQALVADCCSALETGGWLAEDAMIYVETERDWDPQVPAHWALHRETQAGESTARLYRRHAP